MATHKAPPTAPGWHNPSLQTPKLSGHSASKASSSCPNVSPLSPTSEGDDKHDARLTLEQPPSKRKRDNNYLLDDDVPRHDSPKPLYTTSSSPDAQDVLRVMGGWIQGPISGIREEFSQLVDNIKREISSLQKSRDVLTNTFKEYTDRIQLLESETTIRLKIDDENAARNSSLHTENANQITAFTGKVNDHEERLNKTDTTVASMQTIGKIKEMKFDSEVASLKEEIANLKKEMALSKKDEKEVTGLKGNVAELKDEVAKLSIKLAEQDKKIQDQLQKKEVEQNTAFASMKAEVFNKQKQWNSDVAKQTVVIEILLRSSENSQTRLDILEREGKENTIKFQDDMTAVKIRANESVEACRVQSQNVLDELRADNSMVQFMRGKEIEKQSDRIDRMEEASKERQIKVESRLETLETHAKDTKVNLAVNNRNLDDFGALKDAVTTLEATQAATSAALQLLASKKDLATARANIYRHIEQELTAIRPIWWQDMNQIWTERTEAVKSLVNDAVAMEVQSLCITTTRPKKAPQKKRASIAAGPWHSFQAQPLLLQGPQHSPQIGVQDSPQMATPASQMPPQTAMAPSPPPRLPAHPAPQYPHRTDP